MAPPFEMNRPTLHCASSVASHLPDEAPFRSEAISRSESPPGRYGQASH